MSCCGYSLPEKCLEWCLCLDFLETASLTDWQPERIERARHQERDSHQETRKPSIPSILQGVTYQGGEDGTGMLQTLDYCEWDSKGRRLRVGMWEPGVWVGGYRDVEGRFKHHIVSLCCQIQGGRLLGSSYHFQFNPEITRGEIVVVPFQCCQWCVIPSCCLELTMEREEGNKYVWTRRSTSPCLVNMFPCVKWVHIYYLKKVVEYGEMGSGNAVEEGWIPIQPYYDEMLFNTPERIICLR